MDGWRGTRAGWDGEDEEGSDSDAGRAGGAHAAAGGSTLRRLAVAGLHVPLWLFFHVFYGFPPSFFKLRALLTVSVSRQRRMKARATHPPQRRVAASCAWKFGGATGDSFNCGRDNKNTIFLKLEVRGVFISKLFRLVYPSRLQFSPLSRASLCSTLRTTSFRTFPIHLFVFHVWKTKYSVNKIIK